MPEDEIIAYIERGFDDLDAECANCPAKIFDGLHMAGRARVECAILNEQATGAVGAGGDMLQNIRRKSETDGTDLPTCAPVNNATRAQKTIVEMTRVALRAGSDTCGIDDGDDHFGDLC